MKKFLFYSLSMVFVMCLTLQSPAQTFTSTNAVTAIPDDVYNGTLGSMASIPVTVSGLVPLGIINNVSVRVSASHTWVGDLVIKLQQPGGSLITLISRAGAGETIDNGTGGVGSSANLIIANQITYDDARAIP